MLEFVELTHKQKFFLYQKNLPRAIYNTNGREEEFGYRRDQEIPWGVSRYRGLFQVFPVSFSGPPTLTGSVLSIQVSTPQSSEFRAVYKQFIGMNFQTAKVTTGYYTVLSV